MATVIGSLPRALNREKGNSRRWRRMPARQRKQDHPAIHMEVADQSSAGQVSACGSPLGSPAFAASSPGWHSHLAQLDRTKPTCVRAGENQRGPQQRAGALVLEVAVSELPPGVST